MSRGGTGWSEDEVGRPLTPEEVTLETGEPCTVYPIEAFKKLTPKEMAEAERAVRERFKQQHPRLGDLIPSPRQQVSRLEDRFAALASYVSGLSERVQVLEAQVAALADLARRREAEGGG